MKYLIDELAERLDTEGIPYEIEEVFDGTCLSVGALALTALALIDPNDDEIGLLEVISPIHRADLLTPEQVYDYIMRNY